MVNGTQMDKDAFAYPVEKKLIKMRDDMVTLVKTIAARQVTSVTPSLIVEGLIEPAIHHALYVNVMEITDPAAVATREELRKQNVFPEPLEGVLVEGVPTMSPAK